MDLTRNPDLRRLLIAVGIQSLQQAQGSSYMNSYVVSFLVGTGVKDVFPVIMGESSSSTGTRIVSPRGRSSAWYRYFRHGVS